MNRTTTTILPAVLLLWILNLQGQITIDTTEFYIKYVHLLSNFQEMPNRGGEIVFLGNSITEQGTWSELFCNPRIINRGIGGDTTDGVLHRLDEITESQPTKIFLMIGINDLWNGKDPEYILLRIKEIIKLIRSRSPLTELYVQSLLPTLNKPELPISKVMEINTGIEAMVTGVERTHFLNLYPDFADSSQGNQLKSAFTLDGAHLNGKGYALWKDLIQPFTVDSAEARLRRNLIRLDDMSQPYVFVVAHRGDWRSAPENSLGSLEAAIDLGVDIVEVDLNLSKDGQLVVFHDSRLERTTTGKGKLEKQRMKDLKQLRLLDGLGRPTEFRVPLFEEYLRLAKGRVLLDLDLKSDIPFEQVGALLNEFGMIDQVIVRSNRTHAEAREYFGTFFDQLRYYPGILDSEVNTLAKIQEFEEEQNPPVYVVSFDQYSAPIEEVFQAVRANGDQLWVHTISDSRSGGHGDDRALHDPEGHYGWLIERGVRIIQTDRPEALLQFLRSKGWHD